MYRLGKLREMPVMEIRRRTPPIAGIQRTDANRCEEGPAEKKL